MLSWRLETFLTVLEMERVVELQLSLDIVLSHAQWNRVDRILAKDVELILPSSKEEFEQSGQHVRFCFSPSNETYANIIYSLAPQKLTKIPIHHVTLWAHSGPQNTLNSIFDCWNANEDSAMLYLQNLSDGRFEIGFDASGNVVNSLLLGEYVRFEQAEKDDSNTGKEETN